VRAAAVLLLAAGCLLQILAGYSHRDLSAHAWGSDDAYISYRYARNLAEGRGLVFNPGERVEGFSNLLYVLLLAPAEALVGPDRLYAVSAGLNLLFAAAGLVLLHGFARPRLGDAGAGALAVLFALCPSLWVAVASGLETPLVLLLQIATWVLVERTLSPGEGERRTIGFLCAVAAVSVLTRADGFLTPLLATAFLVLRGRRRAAFAVGAATLAVFGGLCLWRLWYYGWPLPNTYYAKVDGPLGWRVASGGRQLLAAALGTGLLLYLAVFAATAARNLKRPAFPVVFAAAWLAYFVYVGGDFFYDRFLLVLFPMGAFLLLQLLVEKVRSRRLVAALAGLAVVLQLAPLLSDPRFAYSLAKYDRWVFLGRFLGREQPGAVLAIEGAGKVPYFSGLRTIDMLGLTDVHIGHGRPQQGAWFWPGHTKFNLGYVLSRRPDLIASYVPEPGGLRPAFLPPPEVLAAAGYRLVYLVNSDEWSKQPDLFDVRKAGPDEISRRLGQGYRYGVYGREQ